MALPSQIARPMSISATKFTSSRSHRTQSRKMLGWGMLLVVVMGFSWWALTGRGSIAGSGGTTGTKPTTQPSAEEQAQLAAASAMLDAESKSQPLPAGVPLVTNPAPKSEPSSLTMGAPTGKPLDNIAASNTPGTPGTPGTKSPSTTLSNQPPSQPTLRQADPTSNPATTNPAKPEPPATTPPASQPATSPSTPSTGGGTVSSGSAVAFLVTQGDALISQGKPIDARDAYNRALYDPRATESDRSILRDKLATLADAITFSPRIEPNDAMVEQYVFQAGDRLVKLPYTKNLAVDWRLITRVNRIADPGRIGLNQKMKLIKGPFHAIVSKSAFRMDVYSDIKDTAGNRIYVKSFAVGLGEHGSTPTGSFIVKPKSKLVNPKWVNPRTGEKFAADDPKNPIGERWMGLDGTDATTKLLSGYGIHGTVEPQSIGQEKSMGCVRLVDRDIEFVYELLFEGASTVEIRP